MQVQFNINQLKATKETNAVNVRVLERANIELPSNNNSTESIPPPASPSTPPPQQQSPQQVIFLCNIFGDIANWHLLVSLDPLWAKGSFLTKLAINRDKGNRISKAINTNCVFSILNQNYINPKDTGMLAILHILTRGWDPLCISTISRDYHENGLFEATFVFQIEPRLLNFFLILFSSFFKNLDFYKNCFSRHRLNRYEMSMSWLRLLKKGGGANSLWQ